MSFVIAFAMIFCMPRTPMMTVYTNPHAFLMLSTAFSDSFFFGERRRCICDIDDDGRDILADCERREFFLYLQDIRFVEVRQIGEYHPFVFVFDYFQSFNHDGFSPLFEMFRLNHIQCGTGVNRKIPINGASHRHYID
jgi:hypothetical protein